jgi:signal transduction histidine kinase
MKLRWTERKQAVADVLMALAIAVEGQVEAWTAPAGTMSATPHVVGSRPALAASYFVVSLALVARRRHPVGVLVVMVIAASLPALVYGTSQGFGQVLPFTVAMYTVGAHCTRRTSGGCLAALLGLIALEQALDPAVKKATDLVGVMPFLVLLVLLPWVTGLYVRTRRLYVAELRDRALRAEDEREERARAAVIDEQRRIARELHDAVAHTISVMVVQAEAAEEMLSGDPERARLPVQRIQRVGREGLAEMRRLLGVLRGGESPETAPQPGLSRLDALADEVRAAGLPVEVTVEGVPRLLSVGIDISAYRIVQEALTNVLKHARASKVDVCVRYGSTLELDVEDDGVGSTAGHNGGHGLIGMRERVALFGGTLETGSQGLGYRVHAVFPLQEPP